MGTGDRLQFENALNQLLAKWGNAQDGTPYGLQSVPVYKQAQLYGNATATTNFTGTAMTGVGGFSAMEIFVGIGTGQGTSPTLDVFVDSRLEGTTWVNIGHLPQFLATGVNHIARWSKRVGTAVSRAADADAGAGTIRDIAWANDVRVRGTIGGTSPSYDLAIWANFIA